MRTNPLAYTPDDGALGRAGAAAACTWAFALAVVAFVTSNPILLAGAVAAGSLAAWLSDAGSALRLATRLGLGLGVLIVVINGLVVQRGATIWVRGFELPLLGQIDITAEALAEGGVLALRIWAVFIVFAVFSARVDPDRVLALLRPLAARSALTATLISRLVPLAAADHTRLSEAAALRGPGATSVGRTALARRLLAGSLDRAVGAAATLELRGYGERLPRIRRQRRRPRPGDIELAAFGVATLVVVVAARLGGFGRFDAYPVLSFDSGPVTFAAAALIIALPLAPIMLGAARGRPPARSGGTNG